MNIFLSIRSTEINFKRTAAVCGLVIRLQKKQKKTILNLDFWRCMFLTLIAKCFNDIFEGFLEEFNMHEYTELLKKF